MGFLRNLLKGSDSNANLFRFSDTINGVELNSRLLEDLFQRKLHGHIQRGFLSKKECEDLVINFYKEVGTSKDPKSTLIYPPNFYQIRNENVDAKHYQRAKDYIEQFPSTYGVDVHEKFFSFLQSIHPNVKVEIPPGKENGYYQPTTFRSLPPDETVMFAHCENQLRELFDAHCAYLSEMTDIYDSLSFFVMLQEPEQGGRLVLYNVDWDRAKKGGASRTNSVELVTGERINLDAKGSSIENVKIDMKAGDLILFPGGQVWHSVEPVSGSTNRVTFGGFLSKGKKDADTLFVWS